MKTVLRLKQSFRGNHYSARIVGTGSRKEKDSISNLDERNRPGKKKKKRRDKGNGEQNIKKWERSSRREENKRGESAPLLKQKVQTVNQRKDFKE